MNKILGYIFFLTTIFAVSSALNCTLCNGTGTTCTDNVGIRKCPAAGDGRCGRVYFVQDGVQKVLGNCALVDICNSSVDCNKKGFEFGKRYKNATNCVVSCCDRDKCVPKDPLQCHQCQGEGETCKNSMGCGYEDDRCLRINFKVGEKLMTDERCYKSGSCSKTSDICALVKKDYPMAKDCKPTCCEKPNCNGEVEPVSSALNCTLCNGTGTTCTDNVGIRKCPAAGDGRCGRVYFVQDGAQKVLGNCAQLVDICNSSVDCNKEGFEFGKRYKNATNCVVSCCDGDNCVPKDPLQCHQCQGEGETCKNSMGCGYEDDRCLRINFKVGEKMMTDERCYKSWSCSKTSDICALVKKDHPMAKDCKPTCCEKPNCNGEVEPGDYSNELAASNFLIGFLILIATSILNL